MSSMKKLVLIIFCLLTAFSGISARKFVKKWIIIKDTENKIVYIDTSSIRKSDGQLSLWSLVKYKQPKEFVMYQGKVSQVKSHILFNTVQNRYTVIGALFYDKRARIIGESSTPAISGNQKIISSPLIKDSDQQILLDKANEYISTGKVVKEVPKNILDEKPKEFAVHKYSEPEKVITDTVINPFGNFPSQPVLSEDSTIIKNSIGSELRDELTKPDAIDSSAAVEQPIEEKPENTVADSIGNLIGMQLQDALKTEEDNSTSTYIPQQIPAPPVIGKSKPILIPLERVKFTDEKVNNNKNNSTTDNYGTKYSDNTSYNSDAEEQVAKNIWSDGNLYVIQLSSWRSKSKAASLVKKLKMQGNDAFVFEKYIPQKKRKYYRVRVGYFSTLTEAKNYLKNIK